MEGYFMFRELSPEEVETFIRKQITGVLKQGPTALTKHILSATFKRLQYLFGNGSFGIVSPCCVDQTRKEKFESMYDFTQRLREKKLYHIIHNGYWEFIDSKSFFIPGINRDTTDKIACEIDQAFYIHGEEKHWRCYGIGKDDAVERGTAFKVLEIDEQFFLYQRVRRNKEYLMNLKTEVIKHKSKRTAKRILPAIERKISDYTQMERAIIGGTLWK